MTPKVDRAKERLGDPMLPAAERRDRATLGSCVEVLRDGRRVRAHGFTPTHLPREMRIRVHHRLVHCGPKPETAQVPSCRWPGKRARVFGPGEHRCAVKPDTLSMRLTTRRPSNVPRESSTQHVCAL